MGSEHDPRINVRGGLKPNKLLFPSQRPAIVHYPIPDHVLVLPNQDHKNRRDANLQLDHVYSIPWVKVQIFFDLPDQRRGLRLPSREPVMDPIGGYRRP